MRPERIALAAGLVFAPFAAYADAASETVTAQTHADLAAHASDLAGVHMHLHHAVNCLVGPAGVGFDAKELNPCANAGSGAIPDTTDAGRKKLLEQAVTEAESGIAATQLAAAQKAATATAAMLKGK
jgi:hypothetical protein